MVQYVIEHNLNGKQLSISLYFRNITLVAVRGRPHCGDQFEPVDRSASLVRQKVLEECQALAVAQTQGFLRLDLPQARAQDVPVDYAPSNTVGQEVRHLGREKNHHLLSWDNSSVLTRTFDRW